jgi:hypothetical protein
MSINWPPVVGGVPAKNSGRDNKPIRRVVIHSAVMKCEPGAARRLAQMNAAGSTGGSWHYSVDPEATFQCSYDSYVCWHAPPNTGSLGIEMADWPSKVNGARWCLPKQLKMLKRTAKITATICVHYDLPPRFLSLKILRKNPDAKGVTTHNNVSRRWGQSSHWDPGVWPRRLFMRWVRVEYNRIKGK